MRRFFEIFIPVIIMSFTAVFLFSSCSSHDSAGLVSCNSQNTEELKIEDNNFEFSPKNGGKTVLDYSVSGIEADKLYDIEFEFTILNDSHFQNDDDIAISVNTKENFDINGKYTYSVPEKHDNTYIIHHIFAADKNGETGFTVSVGTEKNLFYGIIRLKSMKIYDAEECDAIKVLCDKNQEIKFVFNKNDFNDLNAVKLNAQAYLNECVNLKRYLCEFSGVDDVTYIFVFNENISHSGLSGQIIYINHSKIEDLFSQNIEDTATINNFISLLCHEMSHRFDFDTDFKNTFEYCFDKEFFTVLRQIYALSSCGYKISYDYLGDKEYLSNNIYNYQDFLKEYLLSVDVLNQPQNWKFISNVIKNHSSINKHITDYKKVEMLISETSNEARYNIIDKFGKKKYECVLNHFANCNS